ncbi:hypothetical protein BCR39DRAFT_542389 [Naematelia encephala]|uniref:Actin cytoskeleton-regulatory complex protein PAN1 n=1 Tax=Naematelia encephala TaxID=71784 RepID=A0A1Y2ATY0_9TREE|nr:hypothetical protein BCR39DRAFT_542389 [Naematelia encephala]
MQPNQWQQSYPSYGFNQQPNFPQQTGAPGGMGNPSFLNSQQTGFPGGGMQPMQTGFQQQRPSQGLAPAQTGMQTGGGSYSFLNQPPPLSFRPSGLAPQMTGYPGGGASGLMPQQTGFMGGMMSQPTGMGMMSQPTGMGGLRPQPTGFMDPRLQTMTQSFMPSNMSQPFAPSGAPVFNSTPQNQPLANTFQSLLQNPSVKTPKVPWTLSKQEKKDYDQIFRAWEKGDGFISGETAREVFGQSGLGQDDLMKIWTLSDVDNRGKLNLPEFHVAMGLIYRALNGNEIPDKLPDELVPASMRDIDTTVNFMRDLLRHESNTRSDASSPSYANPAAASRDASSYKHSDAPASTTYRPSSRHLDRKAVRYAGEEADADIKDIRRQLQNTSDLLSRTAEESKRKSAEDEALEQEIDDLKYKVKRIQEDIEYVSKGRRTADKDEERRKLERELLFLMHEKLPELERRQEQREDEKRMQERAEVRARDQRNESHGRYGGYDDRDEGRDRDWLRGTYDRDREREREQDYGRRDSRDRSRDRDYDRYERDRRSERPRSPPAARSPAPVPPPSAPAAASSAPPPPKPSAPAPQTKHMTPEERTAFIREQAQRRIQERLKALGVDPGPSEEPAVDKSVEDRLEQEKKEAEERARKADAEQAAREQARQARLAGGTADAAPTPPEAPKSILKKAGPPAPPPSKGAKQPPAPPTPRGGKAAAPPAVARPVSPAAPPAPEEDPEEAELRRREEAIAKAKEERRRRLAELEAQEEEERKQEEARRAAKSAVKSPASEAAPTPPSAPPAPPAPEAASPSAGGGGHNPFLKPRQSSSTASTAAASGGFNPFFRPPASTSNSSEAAPSGSAAPAPSADAPPPPPPPPAPPAPAFQAPRAAQTSQSSDSWEEVGAQEIEQHDSDDSSDDDYANSRMKRSALAGALFGNLGGGSRPSSTPPVAPPAPKAPPAALAKLGGGVPAPGGGMNALLGAIQSGARLKKTETIDKSGPPVSGHVVGDAAPPAHISTAPSLPSPVRETTQPSFESDFTPSDNKRQSVDWYAGLAADQSHPAATFGEYSQLEPTAEEDETKTAGGVPDIAVQDTSSGSMEDFDTTSNIRARTLFAYEGQRDVDLTFKEDVVMVCHKAKDPSSDWWYGMLVNGGEKGWVPKAYVEEIKTVKAKATYSYAGGSDTELPFAEGDLLDIVDSSDPDWWKTEKAGAIFLVPASYLEIVGLSASPAATLPQPTDSSVVTPVPSEALQNLLPSPQPHSPNPSATYLSPAPPAGRPRSSSLQSADASAEESSSDDSVLSWWSSDDDSDSEPDVERNAERQRREDERKEILSAAGLQLRREPPGVPARTERKPSRRRPAPAAPKRRRQAPAVPSRLTSESETATPATPDLEEEPGSVSDVALATGDAYARYEQYLAQARNRPSPSTRPDSTRPASQVTSPQLPETPAPTSPSASSLSLSASLAGRESGGLFSGFLSRMMGPTASHGHGHGTKDENRKSISGPITRVATEDGTTGTGEGDFGKTWSSLVDPGVLDSMSGRERKRQEVGDAHSRRLESMTLMSQAIFEFIATEAAYNRDLQLIVEAFYAPLLSVLDDKALAVIFANVEDILLVNTSFYSSLEQRQKACRLYVDVIGDVLADNMGRMDVYMTYCVNQQQANHLLQSLRTENTALAEHLQNVRETNPAVRGLDLSSFLLIPMQRITRYPLLIKQIVHYTEPDQDLHTLQESLHMVEGIVAQINESVRAAEGEERLRVLSEDLWIGGEGRLDLTAPTQYQGQRRLLKEGQVSKAKSGRKLTLVLCNDVLVLIESRNLYRMPIPLFEVTVREGRDDSVFQLKVEHRRGGDTVGLKTTSAREAKDWVTQIEKARLVAIDARKGEARRSVGFGYP